jgi:hypothetical protein
VVLKVLRFPMIKYANSQRRRMISRLATLVAIIVMIPASFTFWKVYNETKFKVEFKRFLDVEVKSNDALQLMNFDSDYEGKSIELNFFSEVSEATKQDLLNELKNNPEYLNLKDVTLKIKGSDTKSYELISNAYQDARDELKESKNVVSGLQKEIEGLKSEIVKLNQQLENNNNQKNSIPFSSLSRNAKTKFNDLQYFSYSNILESKDFIKIDTLHVATVKWNKPNDSLTIKKEKELSDWLKSELKIKDLIIKH